MTVLMALIPAVLILGVYVFLGSLWFKIFEKMGYRRVWGIVMLLPVANIIALIALAFGRWPIESGPAAGDREKDAKSSPLPLAVMAVIIFLGALPPAGLLTAVTIPHYLRTRAAAQEVFTRKTLEEIHEAIETYHALNEEYPRSEKDMVNVDPPYLARRYHECRLRGYYYTFDFWPGGYKVSAEPVNCGVSGRKVYTLTIGGVIRESECP